uniref:Uncharacterized protein n=1 Tax=Rhizophagus irregularis (strain DAOM 181602 / DAOM 197198 / MUCL 43194) TaxID=747089 RepID=U9SVF7_RHIID
MTLNYWSGGKGLHPCGLFRGTCLCRYYQWNIYDIVTYGCIRGLYRGIFGQIIYFMLRFGIYVRFKKNTIPKDSNYKNLREIGNCGLMTSSQLDFYDQFKQTLLSTKILKKRWYFSAICYYNYYVSKFNDVIKFRQDQ